MEEKIEHIEIGTRNPIQARVFISATSKSHISQFNEIIRNGHDISSDFHIEHGLWLSICGMPIGVCLDPFNHSNYLPYTVIVDIKNVSIRKELDAGRKGISSYRMKQISEKIFQLLKERNFIKYRRYVVGGATDSRISNPLYEPKQELIVKINAKTYFASKLTQKYFPPLEEQEVISLFIELTVNNILNGYFLKVLSGYQVYDGLYEYNLPESKEVEYSDINKLGIHKNVFNRYGGTLKKDILIEFKTHLSNLFADIDNNKKDVSHIDILVCWTVDFNEKEKLQKDRGYILMEKDVTTNVFYGTTHQISGLGRQQPLPIIELKKILKLIFSYSDS